MGRNAILEQWIPKYARVLERTQNPCNKLHNARNTNRNRWDHDKYPTLQTKWTEPRRNYEVTDYIGNPRYSPHRTGPFKIRSPKVQHSGILTLIRYRYVNRTTAEEGRWE